MTKQPTTQTFEFVTFEDAHRARSYAMRQSWRKRKQKILQHQEEEEKAKKDCHGQKPKQKQKQRALAAKQSIKSESMDLEDGVSTSKAKNVDPMDIDSTELNSSSGESDIINPYDNAICIPNDYDQILHISDQDMQFLDAFWQDDLMNKYYDELISENAPIMTMDHILSPLALDPFDTFPISLTTRHHELLHHCTFPRPSFRPEEQQRLMNAGLTSHAAMMFDTDTPSSLNLNFNPMRDVWFPLDLSNAASFYGIMAHSAAHLAYLHGQKDAVEVLKYKSEAVSLINCWMQDEKTAFSAEPSRAAFNIGFKTDLPFWEWLEQPDNLWRLKRFGVGMKGTLEMHNPKAILDGTLYYFLYRSWYAQSCYSTFLGPTPPPAPARAP